MFSAGMSPEAIIAAVVDMEAATSYQRSNGAERQARHRAKIAKEALLSVTSNECNGQKEKSPTPPKEKTTSTSNEVENYQARGVDFEKFWRAYPQRIGSNPKEPARKSFTAAVKRGVDPEEIISGAFSYAAYRADDDPKFTKQAVTWLNQMGWADDYSGRRPSARAGPSPPKDAVMQELAEHLRGFRNEPIASKTIEHEPGYSTRVAKPGSGELAGDCVQRDGEWVNPAIRSLVAGAARRA